MTFSWAYVAGFLDGDGWITSSANKHARTRRYTVGFTQRATSAVFMEGLVQFLLDEGVACGTLRRIVTSPRIPEPVEMMDIRVSKQEDVALMVRRMLPHLVLKQALAMECLAYVDDRLAKRGAFLPATGRQVTRVYWRTAELSTLTDLHQQGYGSRAIAARLGRSENSVIHKLFRLRMVRF